MSDKDINRMDFKQLRNEVQLLRDELAIFKRKYEDAIYNLDSDNFSRGFTIARNNKKAQIKITEEAIKSTVTADYVNLLIGDTYVTEATFSSEILQTAEDIYFSVSQKYETKIDADNAYADLEDYISEVRITANELSSSVTNLENFKKSVFTQTAYGFTLDGDQTTFTGVLFLTNNAGEKRFEIFHDESQFGEEQVFIGSYLAPGYTINLGNAGDTIDFSSCSSVVWGNNAPVAVFG